MSTEWFLWQLSFVCTRVGLYRCHDICPWTAILKVALRIVLRLRVGKRLAKTYTKFEHFSSWILMRKKIIWIWSGCNKCCNDNDNKQIIRAIICYSLHDANDSCANGDREEKAIKIYCVARVAMRVCAVRCSTQRASHTKRKTTQIVSSINVTTALKEQRQMKKNVFPLFVIDMTRVCVCVCVCMDVRLSSWKVLTLGLRHLAFLISPRCCFVCFFYTIFKVCWTD